MTEPTTQAGQRAAARGWRWLPVDEARWNEEDILAIEAEAAQAAVTHCASLEHAAQAAALAEREAEVDMGRLRLAVGILAGTGELRVNYKRDINKETMRIAAAIAREYAALADTPEPTP